MSDLRLLYRLRPAASHNMRICCAEDVFRDSEKLSLQCAHEDPHVVVCRLDDNLLGIPVDCQPRPPAVQTLEAKRPRLNSLTNAGNLYEKDTS